MIVPGSGTGTKTIASNALTLAPTSLIAPVLLSMVMRWVPRAESAKLTFTPYSVVPVVLKARALIEPEGNGAPDSVATAVAAPVVVL